MEAVEAQPSFDNPVYLNGKSPGIGEPQTKQENQKAEET